MIKVLGISGKRGSGKSLLAKFLSHNHGFKQVSLANSLKEMCKRDFGLNDDQVYGTDKESPTGYYRTDGTDLTSRDVMIRMGIFYRSIDPLWWCKKLAMYMDYLDDGLPIQDKFVIDDIRFLNEIKYFTENYNARFVRIDRLPELNIYKAALDDLSESELDSYKLWDWHLPAENNRDSKDLEMFADYLASHV